MAGIAPGTAVASFRLPIGLTALTYIGDCIERVYGTGATVMETRGEAFAILAPADGFGPLKTGKRPPRPTADDGLLTATQTTAEGVSLSIEDGSQIMAGFAEQMIGWLELMGGKNYVEMSFEEPAGSGFTIRLQRADGKSPHQLRQEAEDKLAAVREVLIAGRQAQVARRALALIDGDPS